jgi:membrane-bound serine protease (ClpP class)
MLSWILQDPNTIYLMLLLGLWLAAMAIYLPGSGILEIIALGYLTMVVYILTRAPTNWLAVIVLVVGVLGFLTMPLLLPKAGRYAPGGLLLQAIGGLTLFDGPSPSFIVIAITLAISFAYHRYLLMPILRRHHELALPSEDDALIGAYGRVVKALDPVGTVLVLGEQWSARSDRPLQPGEDIVVLERDGLQLFVEAVKHKRTPQNGREVVATEQREG